MLSALTWLTLSIIADSSLVLPPQTPFGQAPEMPSLVEDLPPPEVHEAGVCYPWRRHDAVGEWIRYAQAYPSAVCQKTIDYTVVGCRMWAEHQKEILSNQHKQLVAKLRIEAKENWQWWEITGIVTGTFLLGSLAGYLAGQYAIP